MRRLTTTSIRTRLLIAYMGIILVGFLGLTLFAGAQVNTAVRAEYEQRLQSDIRLIAQGLAQPVTAYASGQLSADELSAAFKSYESQDGGSLAFYPTGDSRPDGPNFKPRVNSFFNMPEMETALRGETVLVERNNDAGEPTLYTAAPIGSGRQPVGLLQLSVPTRNLQSIIAQRWGVLGIGFVTVTGLALIAALWLSRSIIRPLYKLRESAIRLSKGNLSHRVSPTWNDEIGEVARSFNLMADRLQGMIEEQRAFASNTSHELRTPLTAIRLRTEALRHDPTLDEATAKEYIAEIDDEVVHLADMIQELTLLSRFDAGRAELGSEQVDCTRLASTVTRQVSDHAAEKKITLDLSVIGEPPTVAASLNHLTIVFRNLIDNAIKYTPEGGKITWQISGADRGIRHQIQDNGRGIAAQDLSRVFERFYRADKSHSRDIPGTGLGLSLVKSIVDAYGGSITISSDGIGHGTRVEVFWPDSPRAKPKS